MLLFHAPLGAPEETPHRARVCTIDCTSDAMPQWSPGVCGTRVRGRGCRAGEDGAKSGVCQCVSVGVCLSAYWIGSVSSLHVARVRGVERRSSSVRWQVWGGGVAPACTATPRRAGGTRARRSPLPGAIRIPRSARRSGRRPGVAWRPDSRVPSRVKGMDSLVHRPSLIC